MGINVTNFNTFSNSPFTFDDTNMTVSDIQNKVYEIYKSLVPYSSQLNKIANKSYEGIVIIPLTETSSPSTWQLPDFNTYNTETSDSSEYFVYMAYGNGGFLNPNENKTPPTSGSEVGLGLARSADVFSYESDDYTFIY